MTQLSKTVQLGGFVLDLPYVFNLPTKESISLVNSVAKESKNMDAKKSNKDIFVDAGLSIIGKKDQKGDFINSRFTNNSMK